MKHRVEQVLVPLDFSEHSRSALEFVRNLGETKNVPLVQVAHAVPPLSAAQREILFPYAALGEDDRAFEHELIETSRSLLFETYGLEADEKRLLTEPLVEVGHPHQLLPEWASRFDVDLIALGAFGQSGTYPGGLGSTALRLLGTSSIPVALLRDFDPRPRVRKILVALDLGDQSTEILRVAICLALQTGATLEALHVLPSPWLHDTRGLVRRALNVKIEDLSKQLLPKLNAHYDRTTGDLSFPFGIQEEAQALIPNLQISAGDPGSKVAEAAYEGGHDLIVVGACNHHTSGRRSLGRVAYGVLTEAPTHVLVVPPARRETPLVEADEN